MDLKLADWQLNLPAQKMPKKNYIEQRTMESFLRSKAGLGLLADQLVISSSINQGESSLQHRRPDLMLLSPSSSEESGESIRSDQELEIDQ